MAEVIGQVLGNAVGVALSPLPVIALVLMLLSRSGRTNGPAFLLGWALGLSVLGVVVVLTGLGGSDGEPSTLSLLLKLVIGLLFLVLAVQQWRRRPREGHTPQLPGWMAAVDEFSPLKALGMAALLAAINPKNLGLTVAAAATIAAGGLSTGGELVALGVYVLVASASVLVPVVYAVVGGDGAASTLAAAKTWLEANNNVVMAVLFLVLGTKILGEGLGVLG